MSHNAQQLLPPSIANDLPSDMDYDRDPLVRVKWQTLDDSCTWFIVAYDASTRSCQGFVEQDGLRNLCRFDVEEVIRVATRLGTHVERDLSWEPKPISQLERSWDRGR